MLFKDAENGLKSAHKGLKNSHGTAKSLLMGMSFCISFLCINSVALYEFLAPIWAPQSPVNGGNPTSFYALVHSVGPFVLIFTSVLACTLMMAMLLITRSYLREEHATMDILRLMGASRAYVVKQFQWGLFKLSFMSCLYGILLALCLCVGLSFINMLAHITPLNFAWNDKVWMTLTPIPFLGGIVGLWTCRMEAKRLMSQLEIRRAPY